MRYILFCGSREWPHFTWVRDVMKRLRAAIGEFTVINGKARGADLHSSLAARVLEIPFVEEAPDYETYGRYRAPKIRNTKMAEVYKPEVVVAFWDGESRGTLDMLDKAINVYRIPTLIYTDGGNNGSSRG